jgi:hypothetical protein
MVRLLGGKRWSSPIERKTAYISVSHCSAMQREALDVLLRRSCCMYSFRLFHANAVVLCEQIASTSSSTSDKSESTESEITALPKGQKQGQKQQCELHLQCYPLLGHILRYL